MTGKRFLTAVLSLILLLGLCVPMAGAMDAAAVFEDTIDWDGEYDVVVVGFGGAGAVTSITAADLGANVLLVEKAPLGEEGGNTRYSAQLVLCPTDREKAITYFKGMRGGYDNQTDEMIDVIVDGAMDTRNWVEQMGGENIMEFPLIEYPHLDGSDSMMTFFVGGEIGTSKLWQLLRQNVMDRNENIEVWFESPGKELIQDPVTKIVHGVKIEKDGQLLNIRAKNGVVLATGGFENNEDMIESFVQMPYAYSKAAKYNDGDGIKMAMKAGADLWHMSTLSGPDVNFKTPEMEVANFGYAIQSKSPSILGIAGATNRATIMVGSDGTRFTDESEMPGHGHVNNSGTWVSMQIPTPSFMIFDEESVHAGPMYGSWSADNSAEIEKGYFTIADTLAELAEKLGVDAEGLEKTVKQYNQFCDDGEDIIHGRDPETLFPISESGPYYALELVPTFTNTQGGPKRSVEAEIIDLDGNPIPHLYSAGELGSVYCDVYNGGGNLSECIFFGRIAGANAAAAKSDNADKSVMEGKEPTVSFPEDGGAGEVELGENEYLGTGNGIGGALTVKVTMDGDTIVSVEIISHTETPSIADTALETIPGAIVAAQSTEVDTVTGATVTSRAIIEAVADALSQIG